MQQSPATSKLTLESFEEESKELSIPEIPKSPSIKKDNNVTQPSSPIKVSTEVSLVPLKSEKKEQESDRCCVCLDEKTKEEKEVLECNHWVCIDCAKLLTNMFCPVCRKEITKKSQVLEEAKKNIQKSLENSERVSVLSDMLYSLYVLSFQGLNQESNLLADARSFTDAFKEFIEENPLIAPEILERIFYGFIDFVNIKSLTDPAVLQNLHYAMTLYYPLAYHLMENPFLEETEELFKSFL